MTYSTVSYRDGRNRRTDICEEVLQRGNDQEGGEPWIRNSFWRMRNAFVGKAYFCLYEEFTADFKELLRFFIHQHKGAMQVGILRLSYEMSG